MRMWFVDPSTMCRKHLLGEHVEIHMLQGSLIRRRSISGFIRNNLLAPLAMFSRHDSIALEMIRRGYNHKSPLPHVPMLFSHLPAEELNAVVDAETSRVDLHERCPECRKLWKTQLID